MTSAIANWARVRLGHPHLPFQLAALATLLCLPSLWLGRLADDLLHQAALQGVAGFPLVKRPATELFGFVTGDVAVNRRMLDAGLLPWWTYERLRASLYRPLSGLTHWLDYQLWPNAPALMHVQSLAWLAVVVAAAGSFYRRVMGADMVAGLAALLFAIDDAHGLPACWLANRNATIAMFFGLLTLLAYDRWRRGGWQAGAYLAPLALVFGLFSSEAAVATGAYLLAHALFLDRHPWPRRLVALLPCALAGAVWWTFYKLTGHGVAGSEFYIDPGTNPLRFVVEVVQRAPLLLWGQWACPPSEFSVCLTRWAAVAMWVIALAVLGIIALALAPLLKRDPVARFWGVGMILSVLPSCAALPADRLLMFVGLGGMGLLAQLLASAWTKDQQARVFRGRRTAVRALCAFLIVCHLMIAPVSLALATNGIRFFGGLLDRAAASLPSGPEIQNRRVMIVNTPAAFISIFNPVIQALRGHAVPAQTLVLGSGIYAMQIRRVDARTLAIRPEGGYYAPPGRPPPGREADSPTFDIRYLCQQFDRLFRDDAHGFRRGQRIELRGISIEITAVTADGRPAEAAFRFELPLDDPSLVWLQWQHGVYAPFALPDVGRTTTLPAVAVPF